ASSAILKGERSLSLRTEDAAPQRRRERAGREMPTVQLPPHAVARFEALRRWRGETAREQGVPAYVIFHHSTLREIALNEPGDIGALSRISGVGVGKLERYGHALLEALAAA
ncbi:MAG: HRDC domain-containing protein, partial [Luteimonas sp.]